MGLGGKIPSDSLLLEWTGDTIKALSKRGADKLVHNPALDMLNIKTVPSNGDAFSPAGMNPEQYGDRLEMGILMRSVALSEFAKALYDHLALHIPVESARNAKEALGRSPFFTDVPGLMPEDALTRSAKQALWIGWAKVREWPTGTNSATG